jgi:hypothetical protein
LAANQQENGLFAEQEKKKTLDIGFRVLKIDSSMADDSTATNFEQIFKTYSSGTITKVL